STFFGEKSLEAGGLEKLWERGILAVPLSNWRTSVSWIRLREPTRPSVQRPCDDSQLRLCLARREHNKLDPLSCCRVCRGGSPQICLSGRFGVASTVQQ